MSPKLFPTWRDLWSGFPELTRLLAEAEVALGRRTAAGGQQKGPIPPAHSAAVAVAVRAARFWSNGTPPAQHQDRLAIARAIHAALAPHLSWARWVRWCDLERALLDASATGDVLFAASAIRTMLEEVGRLKALDLNGEQLAALVGGNEQAQARVRKYMGAAWTSISDLSAPQLLPDGVVGNIGKRILLSRRAKAAQGRLNGFVHPNYGSHVAVLYPEGRETAAVLLEAVGAVYEDFKALSFAPEAPPPLPAADCLLWSRCPLLEAFIEEPLAVVSRALDASPYPSPFNVSEVADELTREPPSMLLEEGPPEDLLVDMPPLAPDPGSGHRTWYGARVDEVFSIAFARRSERLLSTQFAQGPPEPASEERLAYDVAALELATLSAQAKIVSLKMQLVRQTVARQPLGIWLAARALVEQWALVLWLPGTIGCALDLAAHEAAGAGLAAAVARVSGSLAEYLATQADDGNLDGRPWSVDGLGRALGRINLPAVIGSAIPNEDFWGKQYTQASAAMHGRRAQALELATNREYLIEQSILSGTLIISRLSVEWDWSLRMVHQLHRLKHACRTEAGRAEDVGARWAFGIGRGGLRPGIDYSGTGTRTAPFVLASHVHYYVGSQWLACAVLGIPPESEKYQTDLKRALDQREDGCMLDHWFAGKRECWIKVEFSRDLETGQA